MSCGKGHNPGPEQRIGRSQKGVLLKTECKDCHKQMSFRREGDRKK